MPIKDRPEGGKEATEDHSSKLYNEAYDARKHDAPKPHTSPSDAHATAEGEAGAMLDGFTLSDDTQQVDSKKAELTRKYGVIFDKRESLPEHEQQHFREPTLAELAVLDQVLNKSPELRGEEVHMVFQDDNTNPALADHQETAPGVTRITVRHTDRDINPVLGDKTGDRRVSLGSVLLHELGHEADHVTPRDNAALGWKVAGKDANGNPDYALETTDGRLYKWVGGDKDPNKKGYWQKVDTDGNPLTDAADSQVPDQEMQSLAKIKQPMHPASHPAETFANAVRMYRQDEQSRAELKQKSPEIYEYIQDYDNRQVRKLGTDFFGVADYKRDEQGNIVKNEYAWNPFLAKVG